MARFAGTVSPDNRSFFKPVHLNLKLAYFTIETVTFNLSSLGIMILPSIADLRGGF